MSMHIPMPMPMYIPNIVRHLSKVNFFNIGFVAQN